MNISSEQFVAIVDEVWQQLPSEFRDQIENTPIVIENEPTKQQLTRVHAEGLLLGLFEGVPKTVWGQSSASIIPNKITIFKNPIIHVSKDFKDLKITVHVVVMHEIAHYFGYNDNDMFVMDKKMREKLLKSDL